MSDTLRYVDPQPWDAREAMACAWAWCEFYKPEERKDSPEEYWKSISSAARARLRKLAEFHLMGDIARGNANVLPPYNTISDDELARLAVLLRRKQHQSLRKLVTLIQVWLSQRWSYR